MDQLQQFKHMLSGASSDVSRMISAMIGSKKYMRRCVVVAFIVLTVACLLFMNNHITLGNGLKTKEVSFERSAGMQLAIKQIHDNDIQTHHLFFPEVCRKRLPNVLVIGVAKAGTAEIRDFLTLNPYITACLNETRYFNKNYENGIDWYINSMPCSYNYQSVIEKTPGYFQTLDAPIRIQTLEDITRFILMVREPVSSAIASFTWGHSEQEMSNFTKCAFKNNKVNPECFYLRSFLYDVHMKNWLQHFKRRQFFIVENTEFKNNPYFVLYKAEDFLNVNHFIRNETFVFNKSKGFYCIRNLRPEKGNMTCYFSKRGRLGDNRLLLNATLVEALKAFYKPHNEAFFKLIGKRFDW